MKKTELLAKKATFRPFCWLSVTQCAVTYGQNVAVVGVVFGIYMAYARVINGIPTICGFAWMVATDL